MDASLPKTQSDLIVKNFLPEIEWLVVCHLDFQGRQQESYRVYGFATREEADLAAGFANSFYNLSVAHRSEVLPAVGRTCLEYQINIELILVLKDGRNVPILFRYVPGLWQVREDRVEIELPE